LPAVTFPPTEPFTAEERALLAPYFSSVDAPVFALTNLPDTVKAALFARYSRYGGTLRRLFLDEFLDSVPDEAPAAHAQGGERAARLFERIFVGYGDDSVAQLAGAHIACEWVSNVVTKVLQRPRLAAYLEQSTRYIAYDAPMPGGGYRYHRDATLGPEYTAALDGLFGTYAALLPRVRAWVETTFPADEGPSPARDRAVKAKALDLLRGLLPAASLSHMGIYATGQAYEQLILHLLAHPLPEARLYGERLLGAARTVLPSFVARIDRADRGGEWTRYLAGRGEAERRWTARLGLDRAEAPEGPSVRLLHVDGTEDQLLAALLFESAEVSEEATARAVAQLGAGERTALLADLVGQRQNRRHRPGRGFEALRYRFEVVSDYGAFRDLQRHRMLTVQWQPFTPALGADVPPEVQEAGCGDDYARALDGSRAEYERLRAAGRPEAAPYALCLGYRIRYVLDLNAREAMHLIELRSGREGHSAYRAVAHEMHDLIAARHPAVAAAMVHVDRTADARLERMASELRGERRRAALAARA
jgi:thymidylate synthase ThyX